MRKIRYFVYLLFLAVWILLTIYLVFCMRENESGSGGDDHQPHNGNTRDPNPITQKVDSTGKQDDAGKKRNTKMIEGRYSEEAVLQNVNSFLPPRLKTNNIGVAAETFTNIIFIYLEETKLKPVGNDALAVFLGRIDYKTSGPFCEPENGLFHYWLNSLDKQESSENLLFFVAILGQTNPEVIHLYTVFSDAQACDFGNSFPYSNREIEINKKQITPRVRQIINQFKIEKGICAKPVK